jgi:hypothetical protein
MEMDIKFYLAFGYNKSRNIVQNATRLYYCAFERFESDNMPNFQCRFEQILFYFLKKIDYYN